MSTTIAVFHNRNDAENAVHELCQWGVANTDISYVERSEEINNTSINRDKAETVTKDTAGGAASGATTGGIIGAIAGLAVANGVLPGLGTLFVAGPIAAALGLTGGAALAASGALTGAAAGGLVGALGGLGVGAKEAKEYEERVKQGDILVAVNTRDMNEDDIEHIFRNNQAEEIEHHTTKTITV
jgi:hypothetical protein